MAWFAIEFWWRLSKLDSSNNREIWLSVLTISRQVGQSQIFTPAGVNIWHFFRIHIHPGKDCCFRHGWEKFWRKNRIVVLNFGIFVFKFGILVLNFGIFALNFGIFVLNFGIFTLTPPGKVLVVLPKYLPLKCARAYVCNIACDKEITVHTITYIRGRSCIPVLLP